MILLIDNYDSFTYNLYQYLCELGAEVEVFRNDKISGRGHRPDGAGAHRRLAGARARRRRRGSASRRSSASPASCPSSASAWATSASARRTGW